MRVNQRRGTPRHGTGVSWMGPETGARRARRGSA